MSNKTKNDDARSDAWNAQHVTAMQFEVVDGITEGLNAAMQWGGLVRDGKCPMCVTCDHEWRAIGDGEAPSFFVVGRPLRMECAPQRGDEMMMVSAVCAECAKRSDMQTRILTELRKQWPNADIGVMPEPGHA